MKDPDSNGHDEGESFEKVTKIIVHQLIKVGRRWVGGCCMGREHIQRRYF
jgi:hypothetical protein